MWNAPGRGHSERSSQVFLSMLPDFSVRWSMAWTQVSVLTTSPTHYRGDIFFPSIIHSVNCLLQLIVILVSVEEMQRCPCKYFLCFMVGIACRVLFVLFFHPFFAKYYPVHFCSTCFHFIWIKKFYFCLANNGVLFLVWQPLFSGYLKISEVKKGFLNIAVDT